jgi:mRNA interferase MazF
MKPGDIVLVPLPQSDGKIKKRPALLLKQMPGYGDWLLCGISSKVNQFIPGFDILLDNRHPDYKNSKIKVPSVIRTGFMTTMSKTQIVGSIGSVSAITYKEIISNLLRHLQKA